MLFLILLWISDTLHSLLHSSCLINAPRRHAILFTSLSIVLILIFKISFATPQVLPLLGKLPILKPPCRYNSHLLNGTPSNHVPTLVMHIIYRIKILQKRIGVRLLESSKGSGTEFSNVLVWFNDNSFKNILVTHVKSNP